MNHIHNIPIEPGQEATERFLDIWGWVVKILYYEIRFPRIERFIRKHIIEINTIDVDKNPIELGWKVQLDDYEDIKGQNLKLLRNTDGQFYIDHKDDKYYIFKS